MKESHPEKGTKPSTTRISQAKEQAIELPFILRDYKGRHYLLLRLVK